MGWFPDLGYNFGLYLFTPWKELSPMQPFNREELMRAIRELPELEGLPLTGKLIVIEGADGSGRSTQIRLLGRWLESKGYAVNQVGIKRSNLAAEQLTLAQKK